MRPVDGNISISRPIVPGNISTDRGKSLASDSTGTAEHCLCLDDSAPRENALRIREALAATKPHQLGSALKKLPLRIVSINALFSVWREYPHVVGRPSTYRSMRYRAGLGLVNRKRVRRSAHVFFFCSPQTDHDPAASLEVAVGVDTCVVEVSVEQTALRWCSVRPT